LPEFGKKDLGASDFDRKSMGRKIAGLRTHRGGFSMWKRTETKQSSPGRSMPPALYVEFGKASRIAERLPAMVAAAAALLSDSTAAAV
jgi:hypothetical protein